MNFYDKFGCDLSTSANARLARAHKALRDVHVNYRPQLELASRFNYLMQRAEQDSDDIRPAMCCFAPEGAGKTYAARRFIDAVQRKWPDELRAVYFSFQTAKGSGSFLHRLIAQIGRDRWKPKPSERREQLEMMLFDIIQAKNTLLLVIDELANANFKHAENTDFTNLLKTILNERLASIALLGLPESMKLIAHSRELMRRIKISCEFHPLTSSADDIIFLSQTMAFVDKEFIRLGVTTAASCLSSSEVVFRLIEASGGGLGYIIDIVKLAAEAAIRRGREHVELDDLAVATDGWLLRMQLLKSNPFRN